MYLLKKKKKRDQVTNVSCSIGNKGSAQICFVCTVLDYPFIKISLMHIIQVGKKSVNYNTFWLLGLMLHCHLEFFPCFAFIC